MELSSSVMLLFGVLVHIIVLNASALQCLDENNYPVDWFIAYKIPALHHGNELIKVGLAYIYLTSNNYSTWISSNIPINATNSIIGNTLSNLYDHQKEVFFILYNDETPYGRKNSDKGHNKGVVLTNNEAGLWLIHSVPKFPSPDFYSYPETGMRFGQSFLCISLDLKYMNTVGLQLQYNEPEIYAQNIPNNLRDLVPNLSAAASNKTVKKAPWYNQVQINSLNGTYFISFAKSKYFEKDLYEDWVAPALQSNLLVETWPDGPGRLNSDCTKQFKVKNVESIAMIVSNVTFNSTHDHSKWAVSLPGNGAFWICIGDINREEHQEKRGGGTVCLKNKQVSEIYQGLVNSVEECK